MTETNPLFDIEALFLKNRRQQANQKITSSTRKMLLLLTEMNMNKQVTSAMLELADMELGHIRYIAGPVIVHRGGWSDCIPAWVFQAIAIDRLKLVFDEYDQGIVGTLVTPAEVLAVMMPASYEAPMQNRWIDVYLWACNEAMVRHNRLRDGVKDTWELIGCSPVQYKSIKDDYEDLARDIRSKVVEAARLNGWGKRTKSNIDHDLKSNSSPSLEIEGQLNILEFSGAEADEDSVAPPPRRQIVQTNLFDLLG